MVERVTVAFAGEGSGVAELTWGQLGMWQSIEESGESRTISGVADLDEGMTLELLAELFGYIMSRHQALRTLLRLRPGRPPLQDCRGAGAIDVEIVDAGDEVPAAVAAGVRERYQTVHFDYEHEWPVRLAVVQAHGRPTHTVAVYLHLALDAGGLSVLLADLGLRDPVTGTGPPVTATPPLEQARKQREPSARRQQASSLRHLEHVLRTVPAHPFGEPAAGREREHVMVRYRSPATLLAARSAAAAIGTGTSAVLLASFAVGLARATGANPVLALVMVSNRFRPGLAESVSAVAQITPLMIDVADVTLVEAVGRAARGALSAYKNGYSDPYLQDQVVERVNRERGEVVELACYYNDRRQQEREGRAGEAPPTAEQIHDALGRSTLEWLDDPEMPKTGVYLYVDDPPGAIDFIMSVDTRYFSPADLEALVRDMEAVTVGMALAPGTPTGVATAAVTPATSPA